MTLSGFFFTQPCFNFYLVALEPLGLELLAVVPKVTKNTLLSVTVRSGAFFPSKLRYGIDSCYVNLLLS